MLQIRWHGHSCFEITNDVTLVTDPHDGKSIGISPPDVTGDIILVSHDHYDHNSIESVVKEKSIVVKDEIAKTVSGVQIKSIRSFHDEHEGRKRGSNLIYLFNMDDIAFCHLGDLGHLLDEDAVQQIGDVDILFIPVGGNFTIDAEKAWNVINGIKPKIAIPMHYKFGGLSLPIAEIDPFLAKNNFDVLHVGNEIDIEREDLPENPEIWIFTS
ncbi:MAG: MBL fold metallo-hydrolase [Thermoplasmatales archaeon]|nr:MBL fold metallo-hydrolase [Thermoplasmatales archaeon]